MLLDYYSILEVSKEALDEEIKRAYHEKAKTYHPDVYKGAEGDLKFKLINEAYRTLINPQRRRQYDFRLRYGNLIEFKYRMQHTDTKRDAMRREYIRRKKEEERLGFQENKKAQRVMNNILFWSMAGILGLGLIFSIIDAWLNFHFYTLVFFVVSIGLSVLAYFQFIRSSKK